MRVVADLIVRTLKARTDEGEIDAVRSEVAALCAAFPPYPDLWPARARHRLVRPRPGVAAGATPR